MDTKADDNATVWRRKSKVKKEKEKNQRRWMKQGDEKGEMKN